MKKLLSFIMAAVLIITLLPAPVTAESVTLEQDSGESLLTTTGSAAAMPDEHTSGAAIASPAQEVAVPQPEIPPAMTMVPVVMSPPANLRYEPLTMDPAVLNGDCIVPNDAGLEEIFNAKLDHGWALCETGIKVISADASIASYLDSERRVIKGGLPESGNLTVNGVPYKFADYKDNDCIRLTNEYRSQTVVLETVGSYEEIYVLGTAGGPGAGNYANFSVTVNYTDNTTSVLNYRLYDWYDGTDVSGVYKDPSILRFGKNFNYTDPDYTVNGSITAGPYLQAASLATDPNKLVRSITFKMNGKNGGSNCSGLYSVVLAVTGSKPEGVPDAPAASSSNISFSTADLSWTAVEGASGYVFDVSESKTFGSFVGDYNNKSTTETSAALTGLSPGTSYYGRVRAVNSAGQSLSSNIVSFTTKATASITRSGVTVCYATVQDAVNAAQAGDTVKMITDSIENTVTVDSGKTITLDLNGFVLSPVSDRVITNSGTLTVTDSNPSASHYYTVNAAGKWVWNDENTSGAKAYSSLNGRPAENDVIMVPGGAITGGLRTDSNGQVSGGAGILSYGDLTLEGGNIIGNQVKQYGGGIAVTNSKTFVMNGGRVVGNITTGKVSWSGNGGGVSAAFCFTGSRNDCRIIIKDGDINFNTAERYGGGLYLHTGSLVIEGGKVQYNYAGIGGGAVCSDVDMTMTGGKTQYNSTGSKYPGAILFNQSLYAGGSPVVKDNVNSAGKPANVLLQNGKIITLGDGTDAHTYVDETGEPQNVPALAAKASVWVTTEKKPAKGAPVAVTGENSTDCSKPFFADESPDYRIFNVRSGDTQIVKLSVHEHTWNYAADTEDTTGATLKAWCTETYGAASCDHNTAANAQKLTILAPAATTYDGNDKLAAFKDGKTSLGGASGLDIAYSYKEKSDGSYKAAANLKSEGYYKASITIGGATASVEYAITKIPSSVATMPVAAAGLVYNGSAQKLISNVPAATNGTMQYAIGKNAVTAPDSGWGESIPTGTSAGTYYVWYKSVGTTIYGDSEAVCLSVSVGQKEITVEAGTFKVSKVYDGKTLAGAASGALAVTGIQPCDTGVSVKAGTIPAYSAADVTCSDVLTIPVSIVGDTNSNYKLTADTVSVTGEITKRPITVVSGITAADRTYLPGDTSVELSVKNAVLSGKVSGDTLSVTASGVMDDENAGNKSVTITINSLTAASAHNYMLAEEGHQAAATVTIFNASQSAPDVEKNDESVRGRADGELKGVTDAMEYRKSSEKNYTKVPAGATAVDNLAPGEYRVRYAKKANYDPSPDTVLTIGQGSFMTLTFNSAGGTQANAISGIRWQDTVSVPETEKTGYTFIEWNTAEDGSGTKLEAGTKIEADDTYYAIWQANCYTVSFFANEGEGAMDVQSFLYDEEEKLDCNLFVRDLFNFTGWAKTADAGYAEYLDEASVKNLLSEAGGNLNLYAIWTEKPVYTISGVVQQQTSSAPETVFHALVELKQGREVVASVYTDDNGIYTLTGIVSGEYDLVITGGTAGLPEKTTTSLISVKDSDIAGADRMLPQGNVSSIVEVKEDTPKIVAGGLETEAAAQAENNISDEIRLVLTVESVKDVTGDPDADAQDVAAQTAIKTAACGKNVSFIDMDVMKFVNDMDSTVHETENVLEIIIPFTTKGRSSISVYRFHDADGDGTLDEGQKIAMKKLGRRPQTPYKDNTYYVGDGFLAVYTKYFSSYAIGYKEGSGKKAVPAKAVSAVPDEDTRCPQDETCVYAKFMDADTNAWYHDAVHFCVENGYMNGVGASQFDPSGTLSRAMIVTMLWNMEGCPSVDCEICFEDVTEGKWYSEAIRWAQANKIVSGYGVRNFGPDDPVTREQLAAILMHYAAFKGVDVSQRSGLGKFSDVKSISGWALENVRWANAVGMINGRTETIIAPVDSTTRAEAASMLWSFCKSVVK